VRYYCFGKVVDSLRVVFLAETRVALLFELDAQGLALLVSHHI